MTLGIFPALGFVPRFGTLQSETLGRLKALADTMVDCKALIHAVFSAPAESGIRFCDTSSCLTKYALVSLLSREVNCVPLGMVKSGSQIISRPSPQRVGSCVALV